MKSVDEVKKDLVEVIKHIRFAIEEAAREGKPYLGIISMKDSHSGRVMCRFDTEFIEGVALVVGAPDQLTDEDRMACRARSFLDNMGIGHEQQQH